MKVRLKNQNTGIVKEAKAGFSWTTLFFGFFVALIRGDLKWAAIMFIINAVTIAILGPIGPILWIIWGIAYNKIYIKDLYEKGYRGLTQEDESIAMSYIG